jgi:hypothetical protein
MYLPYLNPLFRLTIVIILRLKLLDKDTTIFSQIQVVKTQEVHEPGEVLSLAETQRTEREKEGERKRYADNC